MAVIRQMLYGNEQPSYFAPLVDVRDVAQAWGGGRGEAGLGSMGHKGLWRDIGIWGIFV